MTLVQRLHFESCLCMIFWVFVCVCDCKYNTWTFYWTWLINILCHNDALMSLLFWFWFVRFSRLHYYLFILSVFFFPTWWSTPMNYFSFFTLEVWLWLAISVFWHNNLTTKYSSFFPFKKQLFIQTHITLLTPHRFFVSIRIDRLHLRWTLSKNTTFDNLIDLLISKRSLRYNQFHH